MIAHVILSLFIILTLSTCSTMYPEINRDFPERPPENLREDILNKLHKSGQVETTTP